MSGARLSDLLEDRFGTAPNVPEDIENSDALKRLAARASCRRFTDRQIDLKRLQTLCATALCSPSKSDLQQRDILIVTNQDLLNALKTLLAAQTWVADAPAMLVFLANNRRQRQVQDVHAQPFPNDHLDAFFNASVDAGIALATFMTAAEAIGMGCCPISTIRNHLPEVRDLLMLPDHVFPVAGMAVGYPAERGGISARLPLGSTVHHDHFRDITREEITAYDTRRLNGADAPRWSEAKARMYAAPQRTDFGTFIRNIGFNLD
ncbi:nitroreductase family protein [uncultured Roseobacter sp.]|uniref:nitroreductase family protein n=1 Tax=uncultured Roseobacter sp. TaxID=114847 RepID=UPI00262D2D67|nr:nitroreductase family protein [uncultured Roseobacter sp.]